VVSAVNMIDLNDVIAGMEPSGVKGAKKPFRGNCGRQNPDLMNLRFRCINPARLNPASRTKPKHVILESVNQDALLTQPTFNPLPWVLLAIAFVVIVGFVAGPLGGKVMTCVGALVWFYILFCSEPMDGGSTAMTGFDAFPATNRKTSDRTDAQTDYLSNTVSTAVWSLRPPSRHALTYAELTSFRPPSRWNT
jgi:hypothetical protein